MIAAIPAEWTVRPLGDLARVYSGGTPLRSVASYWNGPIPWVTTTEIDFGTIKAARQSITEAGLKASAAKIAPPGTVLIAMYGQGKTRGKSAMLGVPAAMNQACAAVEVHPGLSSAYLLQYLASEYDAIRALSNSGGQENLSGEIVKKIPIVVPTPPEQERIADVLHDADALLSSLSRLLAKKTAMRQGMRQQLLSGATRLLGFDATWQRERLSDLLSYEQPTPFLVRSTKQLFSGRVPVLTAGKSFVLGYTNDTDGVYTDHPVVIFDDFTTATKYVSFDFKVKSSALKILSAAPGANLRFLYERMQLIDFPLGDHKRYWISEYGQQIIEVPAQDEQDAIAAALTDADEEIDSLRRCQIKAQLIKQGMMQELLTGRSRLPSAEMAS